MMHNVEAYTRRDPQQIIDVRFLYELLNRKLSGLAITTFALPDLATATMDKIAPHSAWPQIGRQDVTAAIYELIELTSDSEGVYRASWHAFTQAWELIEAVNSYLEANKLLFPPADVYGDGEGGVRIEWQRGQRELRLQIPGVPEKGGYLYYQEGTDHGIEEPLKVSTILRRLSWLEQA